LLLAGVSTTIANLLLKQSRLVMVPDIPWYEKFFTLYFIGAMIFFVINLGLFTIALDEIPISVGYPILAASGFSMLAVSAAMIFGEHFGPWQITGVLLVLAGIFALAQGR
jgi:multidrug transporter EmrE-like cation transporter